MEPDEHMRLLGEATGRSQQLELCTAQILARALPVTESTARLLASKMGQAAILQVLAELAGRRECGTLDPTALTNWVMVAQRANRARNHVIHSPWVTDGGKEVVSVLANGSMKVVPRGEAELRQNIDDLTSAVLASIEIR
jgi:hypothetical protein